MNSNRKFIRQLERIQSAAFQAEDLSELHGAVQMMEAEFMTPRERHLFETVVDILGRFERSSWTQIRHCFEAGREVVDASQMTYEQYLETDHWKLIRQQKLIQSHYRCQICNSSDSPQVHHRTYERIGREDLADLTVLCGDCHAKFHDKIPSGMLAGVARCDHKESA